MSKREPTQTSTHLTRMWMPSRFRPNVVSVLRSAAVVVLGVVIAAGSPVGSASASSKSPLAQALTYSKCMRNHGVSNFPDPVRTPSGGYGYVTKGIDPKSPIFQDALLACKNLPSPWNSNGQQLTHAEQKRWLKWARCIRTHGVPAFPDPTFSGREVSEPGIELNSPQLQSAMNACKSNKPSVGGLGG